MKFLVPCYTQGLELFVDYKPKSPGKQTLIFDAGFYSLGIIETLGIAMLRIYGKIVMGIISKRPLKELVLYSPQPVVGQGKAGKSPERVQIGPNGVGWVEDEILERI